MTPPHTSARLTTAIAATGNTGLIKRLPPRFFEEYGDVSLPRLERHVASATPFRVFQGYIGTGTDEQTNGFEVSTFSG